MLGTLRRYVLRQKFKRLVAEFDRQIEDARAKHLPVRDLERAKSAYVHSLLERRA